MTRTHTRKLLALLLSGAWLPATITCRPGTFDAIIDVVTPRSIVVEDYGYPGCCYDDVVVVDDGWRGFDFDFWWDD